MKPESIQNPGLIFLIAMLATGVAHGGEESTDDVKNIAVTAAQEYVADHDNAVILDVRTQAEFDMSHITGAINVPVQDEEFDSMIAALDRDATYVVHCTRNPADGRSARALDALQSLGFKNLYSLEGGYVAWKDAELPLTEAED